MWWRWWQPTLWRSSNFIDDYIRYYLGGWRILWWIRRK